MAIIVRGMNTLRRFENWAAPLVMVAAVILLLYMVTKAHGFGAVLSEPARLGWGSRFWPVFFPSLMAMIAFWSTMSLNMPKPLYNYNWVVGFAVALVLYWGLAMISVRRSRPGNAPYAGQRG